MQEENTFIYINNYRVVVYICVLKQQKEFQSLNASLLQNGTKKYLFITTEGKISFNILNVLFIKTKYF